MVCGTKSNAGVLEPLFKIKFSNLPDKGPSVFSTFVYKRLLEGFVVYFYTLPSKGVAFLGADLHDGVDWISSRDPDAVKRVRQLHNVEHHLEPQVTLSTEVTA